MALPDILTNNRINIFAHKHQYPLFFEENLLPTVERLHIALQHNSSISIYPDATLKTNNLPTGICCAFEEKSSILLPFILRDPGCGFLMFKVRWTKKEVSSWPQDIGTILNEIEKRALYQTVKNDLGIVQK